MRVMDHSDAMRLHAAEKYVLGDLSWQLRDQYEEHFFSCQQCADELRVTAAFVDGSRAILLANPKATRQAAETRRFAGGWFGWLRPAFAVPVLALLLVTVAYQNLVVIPRLDHASVALDGDFVSLIGANSRGESANIIRVGQAKPAILEVDIPSAGKFTSYVCRLQNESGQSVYEDRISGADAKRSVHLIVPPGKLRPGRYELVIVGAEATKSQTPVEAEIERLKFEVEILP